MTAVLDLGFDATRPSETILGVPVSGGPEMLEQLSAGDAVALAIGDNESRREWFLRLQTQALQIPSLRHPDSSVSRHATLGPGTFVNAQASINAGAEIGANVIVNTGAILDHEVYVGPHSHVAPGARLAGRARVGELTFVGLGANIIDKVSVGARVVVGAGTVVLRDVPDDVTVVGAPARVVS